MDNMINFLLENAKQTVINTRIALSAVGIWEDYSGDSGSANATASTGASTTDTTEGFNTGSDLPPAWD